MKIDATVAESNWTRAAARLSACGIRVTDQRLQIASILLSAPQHLSAEQIAEALRRDGARVSKATVYNTLNLFAARGLIRQLTLDGSCAWFDSNVAPHYHFQDEQTGALSDVALRDVQFSRLPSPPPGMEVAGIDLVIRLRRRS
jgi:Fur family transcriptional regulator, iron response regulator